MAATKRNRQHVITSKGQSLRILKIAVFSQSILLIFLVWMNEILDLPHILLNGVAATPVNWYESIIESVYALCSGIIVYLIILVVFRKNARDVQERKRQKIIYDINSAKEAEASLQKSDERYRLLAENVIDVIWALDKDFRYTYISPSVEKMRGYTVEEAMSLPLQDMFTEKSYRRMMEIFSQATSRYEQGEIPALHRSITFEAELICKDGSAVWVEVTASYIFGPDGKPAGFVGVTRDITERKKAEEEARISREKLRNLHKHSQDVREKERGRVAREIHDELGQVLTALKMDLSFLAKKLPEDLPALRIKTNLMLRFVDMSIQSVKRITMDLRPGLLDHLGLVAAIEWQAEEFRNRTGIKYNLTVEPETISLNPDRSTSIFRIFQEALTNIVRHAHATEVKISLIEKEGFLELTVSDNGIGMSDEQIEDPKSFGLMGIKERAYFSGGQASISGQKGKGTTVSVSIPLDRMRDFDDTSACG